MEKITEYITRTTVTGKNEVRVWKEEILLPTYEVGEEEKNPMFLEKRVYQGSSGVVYPYSVIEKIYDEKKDKPYLAYFLENEYIKIMVLPELGGRVQMAFDKIKQRHFVYYNQVVKPALVGLTGPWISGGIEFNWPQHHRPSTFKPVDCYIEENADGSKTVWCNEVERMFRTKGKHGFTLHPGKAYLEIKVQIFNRTPFPQTFLWWANPAVTVDDHYHSVFPPDVHAVFDHGKRDVSDFPIATGIYYKHDYSVGVDISRYKNIPVPTSYMAIQSKYDFVGGYQEDVRAGLLHVADHHVSPGKKQWTWGNSDFGQAWDRNLTDEDGPYIELMTGVYTDNQPDFSWLQPYEEKSWVQYFMPYSEVGYVKNACKDAIVNVETKDGETEIILYTTSEQKDLHVLLKSVVTPKATTLGGISPTALGGICNSAQQSLSEEIYLNEKINSSPTETYHTKVNTGKSLPEELLLEIRDSNGRLLLSYRAEKPEPKVKPDPACAAKDPQDIESIEQLYLTGLHLEQYRHATYNPMDYYLEALKREPSDVRCNNAAGMYYMRRGQFAKSEPFFRKAIATLTERNPNPYDGEPYYNLGCCLNMQNRKDEAYDSFFKSAWNVAWQDAAYLSLAQIEASKQNWQSALEKVERSLIRNWHNHKARQLKASVLRKMGRKEEALKWIEDSLKIDGFNMGCRFEKYLLDLDDSVLKEMTDLMGNRVHPYIEYALDFVEAGMFFEAEILLSLCIEGETTYPMVYYALGYFASLSGGITNATEHSALSGNCIAAQHHDGITNAAERAKDYYAKASQMSPDRCFPNRIEEVNILQDAMRVNPTDAKAPYYLGNFWYVARQYSEAIECWERSVVLDDKFPTVLRNLALAYYNKRGEKTKAKEALEKAFALDTSDARVLMELDQLYKKLNHPHIERLVFLEKHLSLVEQRDDLFLERITLYNHIGEYEKARQLISSRKFHPWEGGEGKVTGQYVLCRLELAKRAIVEKRFADALVLLHETDVYPHNLGEGKLPVIEENDVDYFKGLAYRGLNDEKNAQHFFSKATRGTSEPTQVFFYNDAQPDKIFYQGLAWRALGDEEKARICFNNLITHGEKHLNDDCRIDYFAVSLPDLAIWDDDLNHRNQIHCNYVMKLGHLGLGDTEK